VPSIEDRLSELGIALPSPTPPHDPLDAVVVHGGIARTSGQLPRADGELQATGLLGHHLTVEDGAAAARLCALNALAVLRVALGSLDAIERVLHVTGFVACVADFDQQPAVVDGASQVLAQILGQAGRHTRSAIGVSALPRGAAVEVEVTVAVRPAG
jgi:enamine deaminase RidA (YjgF/YER057c/UK114 family)